MKIWLLSIGFGVSALLAAAAEPKVFAPANPPEMLRLTNTHSPAHLAAKSFLHGVNLGNYLEAPPGQNWGVTCDAREFAQMRAEGFDHVRVPVGWHHYTGAAPDFKLAPEIFARVDFVVTNALAAGLAVIVNVHHFNAFTDAPTHETEKFVAIWRQVAAHYAAFTNPLAFELLNEPVKAATTAVMNPIYARTIAEIRQTNPHRTIFVGPGKYNSVDELKHLVLPPDDNLIVTVHCYEPFYFTHQGATWAGDDTQMTGIRFPGPPATPLVPDAALKLNPWVTNWLHAYNTQPLEKNPCAPAVIVEKLKFARAWADYYGRPLHLGEFGCLAKIDAESRQNFFTAFRRAAETQQLGWCLWDWSAAFRYWDKGQQQPLPGARQGVFGSGRQN
ncbi:MAG: Endoglucanase precursor [Verrucomicrobiota bacterium]